MFNINPIRYFLLGFLLLNQCVVSLNAQTDSAEYYYKNIHAFKLKSRKIYEYCYMASDTNPDYSLKHMKRLLQLSEEENDSTSIAACKFLIGYCYGNKENFVLSLDYYFKVLPYFESKRDSSMLTNTYNNIGIAYSHQKQNKKAIDYFNKTLAIALAQHREYTCGISYNNLAIEYQNLNQYDASDQYLIKALDVFKKLDIKEFFSSITLNRGVIRFQKKEYDSALAYYRKSYQYLKQYNKQPLYANLANNLGEVFYHLNDYDSSLFYLNYTLASIDTVNDFYSLKETYSHFAKVYFAKKEYDKAYRALLKSNSYSEKIYNDENLKKSLSLEANFNLLKKENELKLFEEKRLYEKKRTKLIYIFGSLLGVTLVVALFILLRRFKEKKKANFELTIQKEKIEEQQKEITDSINYAKQIQTSILPTEETLNKILGDHLLFFQPKDIVSGDFYYVEEINGKKYIGVIDCTGHGVPGGFMSMLAYNALIKTLHDDKLQKPGEILNALSKIVIEHFSQEGKHTMRDGMDMALVVLTPQNGYWNLEYAGAQNPCWIIKATDNAFIELKADKQSIGYVEDFVPYKTKSVQVDYNDTIYLFSDGYADQFGGPNGKKFKYSQMKSLMQIEPQLSLKNRTELLKTSFYEWMEHYDQIDDVCVLGVRVK